LCGGSQLQNSAKHFLEGAPMFDLDALDWKPWPKDPSSRYVDLPIGWRLTQRTPKFYLRRIEAGELVGELYKAENTNELFALIERVKR
jgi:hypothetical protein